MSKTDNLEFETRRGNHITDIRGHEEEYQLLINGFEIMRHTSGLSGFQDLADIQTYKIETECLLKAKFDADKVVCWGRQSMPCHLLVLYDCPSLKVRYTHSYFRCEGIPQPINSTLNIMNPLEIEGPAVAAHVDTTYEDGPALIGRYFVYRGPSPVSTTGKAGPDGKVTSAISMSCCCADPTCTVRGEP